MAGIGDEARTLQAPEPSEAVSVNDERLEAMGFEQRYEPEALLGEGGMGIVSLYRDRQIGRRVAVKVVKRSGDPSARGRFLREARVQGQLEHPAVVPVYDIGIDPQGAAFFTMKRVRGVTLEQVIDRLKAGDPETRARFNRRRLLVAFNSVCLAVDFAHQRGVVHRDLKPANVMLGDFGEVYVLDWGLAKIVGAEDLSATAVGRQNAIGSLESDGETVAGAVLGTPGYMPPEQMKGDLDQIGPPTDVYALGAILFELLALEPLHGTIPQRIVESTLAGPKERPSVRFPEEIPPELESLILRATKLFSFDRFYRPRELSDAIERYLDGERDGERRRELAEHHANAAQQAVDRARTEQSPVFQERRRAMREIGRALALNPTHKGALDAMVELLSQLPERLPEEVTLSIAANERHKLRWISKVGGFAYLSVFLYLPLMLWVGVRDWPPVIALLALSAAASGLSFWTSFRRDPPQTLVLPVLALSSLTFMATTIFFGPLVLPPLLIGINTAIFTLYLPPGYRRLAAISGACSVLLPNALWLAGVIPGYRIEHGVIVLESSVLQSNPGPLVVAAITGMIGAVVTGAFAVTRIRDALARTEQQIFLYAWHLRELVPEAIRAPTDPTPARRASLPPAARG